MNVALSKSSQRQHFTPKGFERIALGVLVTQVLIVLTGAAVRLTGSGLGCSDWPRCESDSFVPPTHYHAIIEFINRMVSLPVLVAVLLAIWAARKRLPYRGELLTLSYAILAGVIAQILVGALVIRFDLLPSTVIVHFLISVILLFFAVVLYHQARMSTELFTDASEPVAAPGATQSPRSQHLPSLASTNQQSSASRYWVSMLAITSLAVMVVGTLVTGSGPHGGDENAARLGLFLPSITRWHSVTAWVFLAVLVITAIYLRKENAPQRLLTQVSVILILALAQGAVGYLQYWNGVPAGLVFLHIVGAISVWVASIWLWLEYNHTTSTPARQEAVAT